MLVTFCYTLSPGWRLPNEPCWPTQRVCPRIISLLRRNEYFFVNLALAHPIERFTFLKWAEWVEYIASNHTFCMHLYLIFCKLWDFQYRASICPFGNIFLHTFSFSWIGLHIIELVDVDCMFSLCLWSIHLLTSNIIQWITNNLNKKNFPDILLSSSATSDVSLQRSKFVKKKKSEFDQYCNSNLFLMSSLMARMRLSSMTLASSVGEAEFNGEVKKSDTTDCATWVRCKGIVVSASAVCEYVLMCSAPMLQLDWKSHDLSSESDM